MAGRMFTSFAKQLPSMHLRAQTAMSVLRTSAGTSGLSKAAQMAAGSSCLSGPALIQRLQSSHVHARGLVMAQHGTAMLGHQMAMRTQAPPAADCSVPNINSSSSSNISTSTGGAGTSTELTACGDSDDEGVLEKASKKKKTINSIYHQPSGPPLLFSQLHRSLSIPQLCMQPSSWGLVRSLSASSMINAAMADTHEPDAQHDDSKDSQLGFKQTVDPQAAVEAFLRQHEITIKSATGKVPPPALTFEDAGFPVGLVKLFKRVGFQQPSPIQAQGWPVALSGQNLIAIASTGSGKTLGYLLPAFARIYTCQMKAKPKPRTSRNPSFDGVLAVVIAPTRELANQIHREVQKWGEPLGITSVVLYGGTSRNANIRDIHRHHPRLLVATPGRLLDLIDSKVLDLSNVRYFVLDEADRCLDMGFGDDIQAIVDQLPNTDERQSLFFSATWPKEVRQLAAGIAGSDPVTVFVGKVSSQPVAAKTITQEVAIVSGWQEKQELVEVYLKKLQEEVSGSEAGGAPAQQPRTRHRGGGSDNALRVLVFASTKIATEKLWRSLSRNRDLPVVEYIHGGLTQSRREGVMRDFTDGRVQVLVATDVAARGLDIPNMTAVINFDAPNPGQSEDYVHRIGRTGRGGNAGRSLILLDKHSPEDAAFAGHLIKILTEAGQQVSKDLLKFARQMPGAGAAARRQHHHHADRWGGRGSQRGRGGYGRRDASDDHRGYERRDASRSHMGYGRRDNADDYTHGGRRDDSDDYTGYGTREDSYGRRPGRVYNNGRGQH